MSPDTNSTRDALILAAGQLFAEHGFDGAGVRAIAERAGANVAAVNYHFGGKENLYLEVLRHVVGHMERTRPSLDRADGAQSVSPGDLAQMVAEVLKARFASFYDPSIPPWHSRMITRSLLEPSSALEVVVEQVFKPDLECLQQLVRLADPGLSEEDAQFMVFTLTSQTVFYMFAQVPVLMVLGKDKYDEDFIKRAAAHAVRVMLRVLNLPDVPPELGHGERAAVEAGASPEEVVDAG